MLSASTLALLMKGPAVMVSNNYMGKVMCIGVVSNVFLITLFKLYNATLFVIRKCLSPLVWNPKKEEKVD